MSCFNSCSQKVDSTLSSGFYALGKRVGGNPWKTVAAALLLAVVLLYGLADFKQEGRQEELFNPRVYKLLKIELTILNFLENRPFLEM
mmetsp:Transcript_10011/g.11523  ORF Transcript_10011/g.11523 Transcript_10011/m.11523 type:complete len:88 (+) Transcript_10011:1-264(+)